MAITVYKSDDPSAPLLDDSIGSLNYLLKAILVDGYGSKVAAGWTMPYDDLINGDSIFENTTGKMYAIRHTQYQYANNSGSTTYEHLAFFRGFTAFSDFDTSTGNFPQIIGDTNPDLTSANSQMLSMIITASAADIALGIAWIAFADDKTLYIIFDHRSPYVPTLDPLIHEWVSYGDTRKMYGIGDYGLFGNDTRENGFIAGGSRNSSNTLTSYDFENEIYALNVSTGAALWVQENVLGDVGCVEYGTYVEKKFQTTNVQGGNNYYTINSTTLPYYIELPEKLDEYAISRTFLYQNINAPENTATVKHSNSLLGYYRGLLVCYNSIRPGAVGKSAMTEGDIVTINGREYFVLAMSVGDATNLYTRLIDLTGWD